MNIPVRFGVISHILSSEYKTPLSHPVPDFSGNKLLRQRQRFIKLKTKRFVILKGGFDLVAKKSDK